MLHGPHLYVAVTRAKYSLAFVVDRRQRRKRAPLHTRLTDADHRVGDLVSLE